MRGDTVYSVYGVHAGRESDVGFGTFRTREEAQAYIAKLLGRQPEHWLRTHHNQGLVIREKIVDVDFEIPDRPMPRERFYAVATPEPNGTDISRSLQADVFDRLAPEDQRRIAGYTRNYSRFHAFEPFRQNSRHYALISRDYTRTAVLDLQTGAIIAEEPETDPPGRNFCPVGFYVPDWWDVNKGSVIPGSDSWTAANEWPDGRFGFVWGCIWGDDSSWKVQYLDLSRIQEGVVRRDERFGYVELAAVNYASPAESAAPPRNPSAPPFIQIHRDGDRMLAWFHVEMKFDLASGENVAWKRTADPWD